MIRRAYRAAWLWLARYFAGLSEHIDSRDPVAMSSIALRHPYARRASAVCPGLPRDGEPLTEAETEAYAALMFAAATPTGVEPDHRQQRGGRNA